MTAKQSFVSQIEGLDVGESHVRIERIPLKAADAQKVNDAVTRVRNSMNQITNRLRKTALMDFSVETTSMISPDRKSIFAMAITTKIREDNREDDQIDI